MLDAENLKIKIKTKAHENNLEPQDIMQMYFFERLLYRISISKYKNNFILKGGLLLSAIFGDERRTTQDMDTMIKGLPLDMKTLENTMWILILLCLIMLVFASLLIWHNTCTTVLFTICIIVWIIGVMYKQ